MSILSCRSVDLVPQSAVDAAGGQWGLARTDAGRRLVVSLPPESPVLGDVEGERQQLAASVLVVGPISPRNAAALRRHLPWLSPVLVGRRTSAGLGDRLGLATPGHVAAIRQAAPAIAPVFAQQSIREMARTRRTPADVIDAATWGAFEAGWRDGFGSDADHLKSPDEIDRCLAAGFTQFTFDPGAFVNADDAAGDAERVRRALEALPWDRLEDSADGLLARYEGRRFDADGVSVVFAGEAAARAAVKYGGAVAHVAALYRHLEQSAGERPFEVEVSVDETETPTTHAEHLLIATELQRLGVSWIGLAPRFVGRFEKGVDYIGDVGEFDRDVEGHAAIARANGGYKLSLHSGSDKFSIYPAIARHTRGLVHLKTAGTSYLEALRVVAAADPGFFSSIYSFSRARYDSDRASYHVSARLDRAAEDAGTMDHPAELLDQFDAREILHVTFGSVLTAVDDEGRPRFADRIKELLERFPHRYAEALERHFVRHLAPFKA